MPWSFASSGNPGGFNMQSSGNPGGMLGVPDVIKNGLALYLDAGNPTSYPGTGTTWTDLSGNGINGTLTLGPTFSSANGGSLVFDGSNDYVALGTSNVTAFAGDFTISTWVNPEYPNLASLNGFIVTKRNTGANLANYQLFYTPAENFQFQIQNTAAGFTIVSGSNITSDGWYHITAVKSGSTMLLYYNAILQNSGTVPSGTIYGTGLTLRVGQNQDLNRPYKGNIAVVQLYDRALPAGEVLLNFEANRRRFGV